MKEPMGAEVIYSYDDDLSNVHIPPRHAYVSFGDYDEQNNVDTFGVDDDTIFYYFPDGEQELLDYISNPASEFVITSYELVYG